MSGPGDAPERRAERLGAELRVLRVEQRRLVEERDRYRALFRASPRPCVVTDLQGVLRDVNAEAAILLGKGKLVGKPLVLRIAKPDRRGFHDLVTQCASGGSPPAIVVTLENRTPDSVRVELGGAQVSDDRLLFVLRDVTTEELAAARQRELIATERRTVEQLQRLDQVRNAFVRAVSHDLQTPLAAIAGLAGLLAESRRIAAADRIAMLQQIRSTAGRMLAQLRELLDVERVGRGEIRLQCRSVDAAELLSGIVGQVDLGQRRLVVEAEPAKILVDPVVVERIVLNLLTNAGQHTPADATVWVRLSREPDGLLLIVEDDGPGVPRELGSQIFEPFHRGSHERHAGGLGVGLALVREFAALHGGYARLETRPGGGASFHVLISEEVGERVPPLR